MISKVKLGLFLMMIGAAVIGVLWNPIFVGLPGGEEKIVPREASKWHVGKGVEYNPTMQYLVTTDKMAFSAKLEFFTDPNSKEMVSVEIDDPKVKAKITQTIPIGPGFTFDNISDEVKPYFTTLDQTIFSIRDLALEDKYLITKAVWGRTFLGQVAKEISITNHGKASFAFGSANAYTISYTISEKENRIWIVDNLPLPVKAEIYDIDGKLQYSYELTSLVAPSTPGLS